MSAVIDAQPIRLITTYAATSSASRRSSWASMPLSTASRTSTQPPTWAPAESSPTSAMAARRARPRGRYAGSRRSPVWWRLRRTCVLPEQGGEGATRDEQLVGCAVLDHAATLEHDDAVGDLDGREALRGDQHRSPGGRRTQPRDDLALGARVDRRERVVEHEHARTAQQRA